MPVGSLLSPITDRDLALEIISTSAMGKAYVTQIGRVCFRSDKLGQAQGHCVLVSRIFPRCFIEALGRRGKKNKQEGKCCAFLQDWRSLLCNWEINTFVKGHSLCHGHTLSLGKIFLSIKVIFHGISLEGQCLRLCLPMQRVWVQSLVGELGSHVPHGQKTKNIKFLKKQAIL